MSREFRDLLTKGAPRLPTRRGPGKPPSGPGVSKIAAHARVFGFFKGLGMSDARAGRHTRQWLRRADTPSKRRQLLDDLGDL